MFLLLLLLQNITLNYKNIITIVLLNNLLKFKIYSLLIFAKLYLKEIYNAH